MTEIKLSDNLNIGFVPFEQFRQSVSGYDVFQALTFIQWISVRLGNQVHRRVHMVKHSPPFNIGDYFLVSTEANAFIAKWLLTYSSTLFSKRYQAKDHARSTVWYNHLDVDLAHYSMNDPDIYKALIRASYTQFHYLRTPAYLAGRYLTLFSAEIGADAQAMCKAAIGLDPEALMAIGLMMYGHLLRVGHLNLSDFIKTSQISTELGRVLSTDNVDRFLGLFSANIAELRRYNQRSSNRRGILPTERFEYNPLWSYPIIKLEQQPQFETHLIVPSMPDLVYASTEGIYYKLMDTYRGAGKRNQFSTAFGTVFKSYVEYLLTRAGVEVEDLDRTQSSGVSKADFIAKANVKTLIEVKKKMMSNDARSCKGNDIEKYIDSIAMDVYKQLFRPWLSTNKTFECVLVALDEWYYFEEKIKALVEARISKLVNPTERPNLASFRFHLVGCTDFEVLIQYLIDHPEKQFGDLIRAKTSKAYYVSMNDFLESDCGYSMDREESIIINQFRRFADKLKASVRSNAT